MDLQTFSIFAFASLMLNITPGNDMIFVATHATNQGIRAGIMASLGIGLGCFLHIFAATIGISAIIVQSAVLFNTVKYIGAGYLIYLGIKSVCSKTKTFDIKETPKQNSDFSIFKRGAITNMLNPKVALFFLAFLPQFIPPQYENTWFLILMLGIWFNISGTLVNILIAIAFGKAGNLLNQHPFFVKWQEKITGCILILLGLKMAFLKNK